MKKTIEAKVANTILERPQEVRVGKELFIVAQPTVMTIIEVSGLVAMMPKIERNTENAFEEVMRTAKGCEILGDILATLILGSKKAVQAKKAQFFNLRPSRISHKALAEKILINISPSEIKELVFLLFNSLEIADFFAFTTFLSEINILKATREVVAMPSGQ
jgi:hypothetical protein